MEIRALSITRPWVLPIVRGLKSIEFRKWATSYRGPILIHTPASTFCDEEMKKWGITPDQCPLSCIIGAAILTDCQTYGSNFGHIMICPIQFQNPNLDTPGARNYWKPKNPKQERAFEKAIAQLPKIA